MNRVEITGRLTKDIEVRKTPNGVSTTTFTVAVDRRNKEQQTADFISVVAWRQSADYLASYGRKGDWVEISGRIQTRNYESDGRRVYVTEIVADEVHLVTNRKESTPAEVQDEVQEGETAWNTTADMPW